MDKQNLASSTYGLLLQLLLQSKHRIHTIADRHGLSAMQAHALSLLDGHPMSMSELGVSLGCDASNVTGIVDRLEAQGLLERQIDPTDRRVKHITISTKGAKIRLKIMDEISNTEAEHLGPVLTTDEMATLHTTLGKLLQRSSELQR